MKRLLTRISAALARTGLPAGLARTVAEVALIAGIAVVLCLFGSLWLSRHDKAVIAADRAASSAAALGNVVAADRAAGAAKDKRDRSFAAEQSNLQEKADAAADDGASPLDALFNELH